MNIEEISKYLFLEINVLGRETKILEQILIWRMIIKKMKFIKRKGRGGDKREKTVKKWGCRERDGEETKEG